MAPGLGQQGAAAGGHPRRRPRRRAAAASQRTARPQTDKSTNGTDARFLSDAGKAGPKVYLTTFGGYPILKPDRKSIINDLALSDYDLQARFLQILRPAPAPAAGRRPPTQPPRVAGCAAVRGQV